MQLHIKHFRDLTLDELYAILKLRVDVFIVEQNCPYYEIDNHDQEAYHLFLSDEEGIQAYLRVMEHGAFFDDVAIGRVISVKRRQGLATKLLREGIRLAKEKFDPPCIVLEAQTYARQLYEGVGFVQSSEEFLEDGIPHIQMTLDCTKKG